MKNRPTIKIEDQSGDRDFFTIVPNFVINHSSAIDRALYLEMKRYAGEDGRCFATQETMMKRLKIGRQAFNKSLDYLLKREWISYVGMTDGKTRPIKTYRVNNIWKENSDFYAKKIPSETAEEEPVKEEPLRRSTYGEFQEVQLSDSEYQKLESSLGEEVMKELITELDAYIASSGKKYKSHYATILNWNRRKMKEQPKGLTIKK